jgi:hypothetical protein
MAFRKELLTQTRFDESSCLAEEKHFLKGYTIPFVQLETQKSILVFSHIHNSFDKKELLAQMPNPHVNETTLVPSDIVKEPEILNFFLNDIDLLLQDYNHGRPENKPDVIKQLTEIKKKREEMIKQHHIQQMNNHQHCQNKINELTFMVQNLSNENNLLKEKNQYLEKKLKEIISDKIQQKIKDKTIQHSSAGPEINII